MQKQLLLKLFLLVSLICTPSADAKQEYSDEVKALRTEMLVTATEEKAIDQVQKLIRKYRGTALEADLQLRLAELYVRRAKTDRFLKVHRMSDELVKLVPQLINKAEPKKQLKLAIDIYDRIEKKWPDFNRMDEVLFNNGFANQQLSYNTKAEQKFLKLIRIYKQSPLIPEAHLSVGEMKFQDKQFSTALKHFNAIQNYPDSRVYPYGLYKAAWAHYNMRDAAQGMKSLEAVIKFGRFVVEQGIDSRLDLRQEALSDLALFYEDVYPAKNAYSYFEKQAGELDASPVILKLSKLYMRHSRHNDNRTLLAEFIKKKNKSDYIPKAYTEMMESSEQLKMHTEVVNLLDDFSGVCNADSKWSTSQKPMVEVQQESPLYQVSDNPKPNLTASMVCNEVFEKTALTYAEKWLKRWQRDTTDVHYANVTEDAFKVYFKKDPKTIAAANAHFVYAELLFKRKKYRDASIQYNIASNRTEKNEIRHDANYYALIALEKAVGDKWTEKDEVHFTKLARKYITDTPKGKYLLEVQFKLAFIAYEKGRYDEAAPLFKRLGNEFAKTEKGLKSQDLYLDILNKKKDYRTLKDYASDLKKNTKSKKRTAKLTKIYEESYFLLIQDLENNKDYDQAIAEYQSFASKNTNSKLAKEALWNAMQINYKKNDLLGGAEAAMQYAKKYSKDKRSVDAMIKAGKTYENLGQLIPASEVLQKLAYIPGQDKNKWLELSAHFLDLSGNISKAKKIYTDLFEKGPKDYSERALARLEYFASESKNPTEHEALLKKMLALGKEPYVSQAEVYFLEKEYEKGDYPKVFQKSLKLVGRSGASANTKARARLIQARILADEYKRQSVKTSIERMNLVLAIKTEKLGKAQKAFQSAARYGDSKVAVVAQSELAELYAHYANTMKTMPVPTGVAEEEAAIFRAEMSKLALPMEEKAFEAKQIAYQQARSIGLDDELAKKLEKEVGQFTNTPISQESLVQFDSPDMLIPYPNGVGS